ncbi:hypothetical protein [Actinomyces howellii]|uniref:Lipoprotein n=1 Tax=Actinomyces howellii TaxID=52771 RepID=A0A448HHE1_9ACTO|nr:hypothetical protein [Actinomyces howellii]VEG28510.1 Uncharacterised protein [Actinomyces howellii]
MKKMSLTGCVSFVAVAALTLSACGGKSVEEARADAYATVESMEGLGRASRDTYEAQLNSAADQAAIDSIVAKAEAENNEELEEDARAEATASASAATIASIEDKLSGVTLRGTSPECKDKTITFNADGTWSGDAGDQYCLGFESPITRYATQTERADYWHVTADNGGAVECLTNSDGTGRIFCRYSLTVSEDGVYSFEMNPYYLDESDKDPELYGVEGVHTFVVDEASPSPTAS